MSEFHFIQMPPDGTGKRSSQVATVEIKYGSATDAFAIGDTVTTDTGFDGEVVLVEEDTATDGEIYCRLNHGSVSTIPVSTVLKVDDVSVAIVTDNTQVFYTQEVTLTGGNNPFNTVSVNDQGALNTTFASGDPLFDAFGKLGTSESTTIREYQPVSDKMEDEFSDTYVGTADIVWDNTRHVVEYSVGTSIGDKASRRSNLYHKYQTGVATTIMWSGFLGDSGKVGCTRRMGFFDDSDGVFFSYEGTGAEIVVRNSTSGGVVETHIPQEDWNVDRLNGEGGSFNISGKTLDISKAQVMVIDFQWLGAGRVRFGFNIDGGTIVCHEVNHANIVSNPYMRTGTLPLSFEMENIAGTASPSYMYTISAAVKCEGKFQPREYIQGGVSQPSETFISGGGLTVDTTTGGGAVTSVTVNDGGTNYQVGDQVVIDGGFPKAIAVVDTVSAGGIVTGTMTVTSGGAGFSNDTAVTTENMGSFGHLMSFRASQTLNGVDNRAVSVPLFVHITEVSGANSPFIVEIIKNDTLTGSFNWLDPYPGNALESTNSTLGGVLDSEGGEVLLTEVHEGHVHLDMTNIFSINSQVVIRKADITDEPDHYSVRIKPVVDGATVKCIAGMTWKEYR